MSCFAVSHWQELVTFCDLRRRQYVFLLPFSKIALPETNNEA